MKLKSDLTSPQVLRVFKILLSLFAVYHLSAILILPNGSSILGRSLANYIVTYANTVGINASWNFFSPDPAHTMYFEYHVHFGDEYGGEGTHPTIEGFLPPNKKGIVTDTSERRLLYAMRFLILDPQKLETILVPWLCRKYEGATSIYVQHIIDRIPLLDVAYRNSDVPLDELREEIQTTKNSFNCPAANATESNKAGT